MNISILSSFNFESIDSSLTDFISNIESIGSCINDSDYGNWLGKAAENFTDSKTELNSLKDNLIQKATDLQGKISNIKILYEEYKTINNNISYFKRQKESWENKSELSPYEQTHLSRINSTLTANKAKLDEKVQEIESACSSL